MRRIALAIVWIRSRTFAGMFMVRNGHGHDNERRKEYCNDGFHFVLVLSEWIRWFDSLQVVIQGLYISCNFHNDNILHNENMYYIRSQGYACTARKVVRMRDGCCHKS